jgi:hypothetical protein
MLLYSSTYVLCIQKIVVVMSISEYIFCLFKKHCDKIVWISLIVGFLSCMMLRNCKYSKYVPWFMEMDKKCYFVVFQHGANLMWQLLHNMSSF